MKQKMVITNLRIPEYEWSQVKMAAAEEGVSINAYITDIIRETRQKRMLGYKEPKQQKRTPRYSIWDLPEIMKKIPRKPIPGGLSEDDEIIYG